MGQQQGRQQKQQEATNEGQLPVPPGCHFELAAAPPNMKHVHCVKDGVVASTYPVLFVGSIFPVGPGLTIQKVKTYYLLELATGTMGGWYPIEHCFFDPNDAQKEAARQRQEK